MTQYAVKIDTLDAHPSEDAFDDEMHVAAVQSRAYAVQFYSRNGDLVLSCSLPIPEELMARALTAAYRELQEYCDREFG